MIYIQFILGGLAYAAMAYASYSESFKQSSLYFPSGIALAIIANLLWFSLAKTESNASQLVIKGLIWDAVLMAAFLVVPFLFFHVKFTTTQAVGVGLTLIGLLLTKV